LRRVVSDRRDRAWWGNARESSSGGGEHRGRNQSACDHCGTVSAMDHHTVASISIAGSCLDVLGTLYLAYDLLGGAHGPLRLLTRAVTYSILFGLGYGLGLGLIFGVASGLAIGVTISVEMNRTSKRQDHFSLPWESFFSIIRAAAFSLALYPQYW